MLEFIFQFPTTADISPLLLAGKGCTSNNRVLVEIVTFFEGGPNKLKLFLR